MCKKFSAVIILVLASSSLEACQFDSSYAPVAWQAPDPAQAGDGGAGGAGGGGGGGAGGAAGAM
jgi:hypothetical protein